MSRSRPSSRINSVLVRRRRLLQATTALAATPWLPSLALAQRRLDELTTPPTAPSRSVIVVTHPEPGRRAVREDGETHVWRIADADNAAFALLAGTTYARLQQLIDAVSETMGWSGFDVAVRLPPGEFDCQGPAIASYRGLGTLALIGATDAAGEPLTALQPKAGNKGIVLRAPADLEHARGAHLQLRDLRIGPLPSVEADHLTAGGFLHPDHRNFDDLVRHSSGGDLVVVNCVLAGSRSGDGIKASGTSSFAAEHARVLVFDSELRNCGVAGTKHNFYISGIAEFRAVRCISYMAAMGHAVKVNCPTAYLIDCHFANFDTRRAVPHIGRQTPVNVSKTTRLWMHRCVMEAGQDRNRVGQTYNEASRESLGGQWAPWMPWPWKTLTFNPRSGDPQTAWRHAGVGENANIFGGRVGEWYSAEPALADKRDGYRHPSGASVIWIRSSGMYGQTVPSTDRLVVGTTYDIRLITVRGDHWQGQGVYRQAANDVYYFDIAPASLPFAVDYIAERNATNSIRSGSYWVAKEPATPWDWPELNPAYWNAASPNYYWQKIDNGKGQPDHINAQDLLSYRWITDCLVMGDYSNDFGQYFALESATNYIYIGRDGASLPRPPMNYPRPADQPAPPDWPDIEGAARWEWFEDSNHASSRFPHGITGTRDDYVQPFFHAFRDVAVRGRRGAAAGDRVRRQMVKRPTASHTDWKEAPAFVLDAAGRARSVEGREGDPFVMAATPEVDGPHAAGIAQIAVSDTAGMEAGLKLHLRYAPERGRKQLHVTTIANLDRRTRTVVLADPVEHALVGGEEIAAFAPAGTKPAWWNDGVG